MGAVEETVDAAAEFIGPYLGKGTIPHEDTIDSSRIVKESLFHLQAIDTAEQGAGPDDPYDGSLVGVVYGLLDLITSAGILPYLPRGMIFGQRPKSVLVVSIPIRNRSDRGVLSEVVDNLVSILEQNGSGVQPLLSQRILPDVISALADLSFSPMIDDQTHAKYRSVYEQVVAGTSTSRLLPLITSFLQQDISLWWKPHLSRELELMPLRPHGVRHTIEFLALSYLSKNSQVPQDASGPQSKLPLPVESLTQAARLLSSVPSEMTSDNWFTQLAPQLFTLLDGNEGIELSRAAGQIIAGGILSKKSTGAPKAIGWELFARPLLDTISPKSAGKVRTNKSPDAEVIVDEEDLRLALRRLATITSSYSHPGLLKRLVGPLVLPLWALLTYTSSRPALDKGWSELPRAIMARYLTLACEVPRIGTISNNLFWDGEPTWKFQPGSQGGVEIRPREQDSDGTGDLGGMLEKMANIDRYIGLLVALLVDSNIEDSVAGAVFIQSTWKWLLPNKTTQSLTEEKDIDPLSALADAKFSEALAFHFQNSFARSPQHIIELMNQLLESFVDEHKAASRDLMNRHKPTRANLNRLVQRPSTEHTNGEMASEDLVTFALSIVNTLLSSSAFKTTPEISTLIENMVPTLHYLSQPEHDPLIPPLICNAASNLVHLIQPTSVSTPSVDPQAQHRATLKTALTDLTSPEPPNRTWAVSTIGKLIEDPVAFPIIDVPAITHALLSAAVADAESFVHTAAIPVVVCLATQSPNPTVRIIVDAFVDIDERSLRLKEEQEIRDALDFRLRTGEILNSIVLEDAFWSSSAVISAKFASLKSIIDASLSLASRRGQRKQTLIKRDLLAEEERKQQEEGEAAWGGPIPNLFDPEGENPAEQAERDALFKIVQGWEDTGIEEDVRVRASALSILGNIMDKRLELLNQVTVDAVLQMVFLILTMETTEVKGILRRAAVLVVMGLLRGMDRCLEVGKDSTISLRARQTEEVQRVMRWSKHEDVDGLVRDHASNVIEGLETWEIKKLYKIRDVQEAGYSRGLEGNLQGLSVQPLQERGKKGLVIEEIP